MLRRLANLLRREHDSGDRAAFLVPTRLVVGLGNPGPKYAATRHNIGFRVIQALAERYQGVWVEDRDCQSMTAIIELGGHTVALMAPQTYMNRSGETVLAALDRWPSLDSASDLLVVYDDLDLPVGRIRLRPKGGNGGHNGIGDILERLDSKQVPRLRFGVGHPGHSKGVLDWVLSPFTAGDETQILPAAIDWAVEAIESALQEGVSSSMGRFNADRSANPR